MERKTVKKEKEKEKEKERVEEQRKKLRRREQEVKLVISYLFNHLPELLGLSGPITKCGFL